MQFWPPDDEHMCSKHVEAWNETYCETNFVLQKVKYGDNLLYTFCPNAVRQNVGLYTIHDLTALEDLHAVCIPNISVLIP